MALQRTVPQRAFLVLSLAFLWAQTPASAQDAAAERARRELEAELERSLAPVPEAELELFWEGVAPGYRLEKAAFLLDDKPVKVVEGPPAHTLSGRFFQKSGVAPGEHVLTSQIVLQEHSPGLFEYGASFTVKSTVKFRTERGLRVAFTIRGVEVNSKGSENRVRLDMQSKVQMLTEVEPTAPAPPEPVAGRNVPVVPPPPALTVPVTPAPVFVPPPPQQQSRSDPSSFPSRGAKPAENSRGVSSAPFMSNESEEDDSESELANWRVRARLLLGAPGSANSQGGETTDGQLVALAPDGGASALDATAMGSDAGLPSVAPLAVTAAEPADAGHSAAAVAVAEPGDIPAPAGNADSSSQFFSEGARRKRIALFIAIVGLALIAAIGVVTRMHKTQR